jgi:hypothetical protein
MNQFLSAFKPTPTLNPKLNSKLNLGTRLEEAKKINQSLSALGKCVAALAASSSTANFLEGATAYNPGLSFPQTCILHQRSP